MGVQLVAACTCKCNVAPVTRVEPTALSAHHRKNVKAPLMWTKRGLINCSGILFIIIMVTMHMIVLFT